MKSRYCVIMAGGVGSRFWPISRSSMPKQFLDITGSGKTFLRETFERFSKILPVGNIFVVTGRIYEDIVIGQLPELPEENIFLEPYGRNTAPCIAYSVFKLMARDPDASMVVAPSDHWIKDEDAFLKNIEEAFDHAERHDSLVTLGIRPTRPETNYGYIQVSAASQHKYRGAAMPVKTFTEKPNLEMAEVFVNSGEFYWNSGIFVWSIKTIHDELERYMPELASQFDGWKDVMWTDAESDFIEKAYGDSPKISIDYAVMEKTEKAWLIPADFLWSDLGTWESLYRCASHKDGKDNLVDVKDFLISEVENSIVLSREKDKLLAIRGLDNFIVVNTDDVLFICPKNEADIKQVVTDLSMSDFNRYK